MRKIAAVFLYLLAIVMLALAPVFGSMAFHDGGSFQSRMALLVYVFVALIPLVLGLLTEPDERMVPAGLILMGAAATGAVLTVLLSATLGNGALMQIFAPGQQLPLSAAGLIVTSLPMSILGAAIWLLGRHWREPANRPNRYHRLQPDPAPEPEDDQTKV